MTPLRAGLCAFVGCVALLRLDVALASALPLLATLAAVAAASTVAGVWLPPARWAATLSVGALMALLAVGRATHVEPDHLSLLPAANVTAEGRVSAVRETWDGSTESLDEVVLVDADGTRLPVTGRLLVRERGTVAAGREGDTISARGAIEPLGEVESYDRYLRSQGYGAVLEAREVLVIESGQGDLWHWLDHQRRASVEQIGRLLPEPHASLLAGLLLGADDRLPGHTKDDFKRAGLTHLTAVSGANVALLLSCLGMALWWVPLRWRYLPSVGAIIAFTFLVGAPASAVRAAITGIIGLTALQLRRLNGARWALLLTIAAMTAWNPRQLWDDAGFQLSFLAVVGLIELQPLLRPRIERIVRIGWASEAIAASLGAELLSVPWAAASFGQLPILSPAFNLVAGLLVPPAIGAGLALWTVATAAPPLAILLAPLSWLSLEGLFQTAHLSAAVPWASLALSTPPLWLLCLYYLAVFAIRLTSGTAAPSPCPTAGAR